MATRASSRARGACLALRALSLGSSAALSSAEKAGLVLLRLIESGSRGAPGETVGAGVEGGVCTFWLIMMMRVVVWAAVLC